MPEEDKEKKPAPTIDGGGRLKLRVYRKEERNPFPPI